MKEGMEKDFKDELISFVNLHGWPVSANTAALYTGFHMINVFMKSLAELEPPAFDSEHKQGRYDNPVAELEKPAEDVELDDAVSDIISSAWDWEVGSDYVEAILRKYAESYHAKKCAGCVGNLPAFLHRTESPNA